jgi:hypothetical protein
MLTAQIREAEMYSSRVDPPLMSTSSGPILGTGTFLTSNSRT